MKGDGLLRRLLLVVLLTCVLGSLMLVVQVGGGNLVMSKDLPSSVGRTSGCGSSTSDPACFTIDTSRPEWLGFAIYLPLILRL